ncbi:MAG: methylmalonyl-CoA epimerase [Ignavibacteriales bacterium]|nr:methylmalonyl-CoA epimerase [Ignavibacteriales bacterium]
MIKRINHIGVAVKSLGLSSDLFAKIFEQPHPHTENVPQQNATIAFFPVGESSIELIESATQDSSISKFIDKRGEGIHHICLEVDDIKKEIERLKKHGFQFVNDHPDEGGDGYLVAFLHPKSTNGVLIELAEKMK